MGQISNITQKILSIPSFEKISEFSQTLINTIVNNEKHRDTEAFSYTKYKKPIDSYIDKEYMVILSQGSEEFKTKYIDLLQKMLYTIQKSDLVKKNMEVNKRNVPVFSIKTYPVWEQYTKKLEAIYKKYAIGK